MIYFLFLGGVPRHGGWVYFKRREKEGCAWVCVRAVARTQMGDLEEI